MSPDWNSGPSPVPYAHFDDPQSLNLYSYVLNNPLSRTDPDGHECTVDGEKHGAFWCFGHALGFTETKAEYQARMDWALKHPITPTQAAALQGENAAVSIIMIGMAGGENTQVDAELETMASPAASGSWITVGRWMSKEELEAMKTTGVAQESTELGGSRVAQPSDPNAYKNAPSGSVYVEYQIPAGSTKSVGSGWAKIPGPNSTEGRLAASKGQPVPQMPPVRNIVVKGQK